MGSVEPTPRELLKVYRTLDNDHRLRIATLLMEEGELPFNEVARRLGVERGLLAYHLGVLRRAGLVDLRVERRGRNTSFYSLTELGIRVLSSLGVRRGERA